MSLLSKKNVIGLTLGTFILTGAVAPFLVHAASESKDGDNRPAIHHHQVDPDKIAQKISNTFGIPKDEILKYQKQGISFRDLHKAAFLAKASDQSLEKVLNTKTLDNTWKDVASTLGVTREKARATYQDISSSKLEAKLNIPKQSSLKLMQQGYHARDIAIANELAKNTGKSMSDLLGMRKINNTWHDVAQSLGISDTTFSQDMKTLKDAFHYGHKNFHKEGF
ncbi:hypothetical protein [Pelosinus sp. sgz500959]|uniref:hypothetical protein n=1 Tax=Pelosinus sp. sgz500959 TaxID=3242472 RepID=UPI00366E98D5